MFVQSFLKMDEIAHFPRAFHVRILDSSSHCMSASHCGENTIFGFKNRIWVEVAQVINIGNFQKTQ